MSVKHGQHLHAMHVVKGNHSHRNWRSNVTQEDESLHIFQPTPGWLDAWSPMGGPADVYTLPKHAHKPSNANDFVLPHEEN